MPLCCRPPEILEIGSRQGMHVAIHASTSHGKSDLMINLYTAHFKQKMWIFAWLNATHCLSCVSDIDMVIWTLWQASLYTQMRINTTQHSSIWCRLTMNNSPMGQQWKVLVHPWATAGPCIHSYHLHYILHKWIIMGEKADEKLRFCPWLYSYNTYLCDAVWSSRLVIGSKRNVAGELNGPRPARLPAATLTVYVTPSVKLANNNVGAVASMVTFVSTRDLFMLISRPRTIMWYVSSTPVNVITSPKRMAAAAAKTSECETWKWNKIFILFDYFIK